MKIPTGHAPETFVAKNAGFAFTLQGRNKAGELVYGVARAAGSSGAHQSPLQANKLLPNFPREGIISNGENRAPMAHSTMTGGVAIPIKGLVGSIAVELCLASAASEMANAWKRLERTERSQSTAQGFSLSF